MNESGTTKIGRPRQIYNGPVKTDYVPMNQRGKGVEQPSTSPKKAA